MNSPLAAIVASLLLAAAPEETTVLFRGEVLDAATGAPVPCRLYIEKEGEAGTEWFHARSADGLSGAVAYRKQNGQCVEIHTSLAAAPFEADLPPGRYRLTAERGPEWLPARMEVTVDREPVRVSLSLRRWVDLPARGWWSGDTHVHRPMAEMPVLLLSEDLHIAFPLSYWGRAATRAPERADPSPFAEKGTLRVDPRHIAVGRNTEYEIFTVNGKRHELGAFFIIGQASPLELKVPPVEPVAARARAEGALIELDKHSWPWSMALVPVMGVDLYELSNNHVWRAGFSFRRWGAPPAPWMGVETDEGGMTERGWIEYGFRNYYALLDCGFRLRPTAGTASGVHPVPLGFSRVYVRIEGPLDERKWLKGLDEGRSFVTTGPMLFLEVEKPPGGTGKARATGTVLSMTPLERLELVMNGEVAAAPPLEGREGTHGTRETRFAADLEVMGTSWIAVRAFEKGPAGRPRFAHTAPVFIDVPGKPLRPRREEAEFLRKRVADEIERSKEVIPAEALAEYQRALRAYEAALERAR